MTHAEARRNTWVSCALLKGQHLGLVHAMTARAEHFSNGLPTFQVGREGVGEVLELCEGASERQARVEEDC